MASFTRFTLILLLSLAPIGCDRQASQSASATPGSPASPAAKDKLRIVTLAPGLSQMLVDLSMQDRIVGIAEYDDAAPEGLPVVGNFTDVRSEALLAVSPTHVLTLRAKERVPAGVRRLADEGYFKLVAWPYPNSPDEVLTILAGHAEPTKSEQAQQPEQPGKASPSFGQVIGKPEQARALAGRIRDHLDGIAQITAPLDKPEVMLVIGTSPFMASGPGTVNSQLLGIAGGRNVARHASGRAPTYNREGLIALQPDVILLLQPNAPALTKDDPRLEMLRDLPIPAVENDRIAVINDPLILLPSTNIDRTCAMFAKAVHPDQRDAIDALFNEQTTEQATEQTTEQARSRTPIPSRSPALTSPASSGSTP